MMSSADTLQRGGWYYGWNIVTVCALAGIAVNGLPVNAYSLFLRDWSLEFHSPISTFQLGFGVFGIITPLLGAGVGVLVDKYPARLIYGFGLVGMALVCLAISFAATTWQLLALYSLGIPAGCAMANLVPANTVVSRWFVRRRGLALGLTSFGLGVAGVILPPIFAGLLSSIGWRMIWRISGIVIALFIAPIVVLVMRDRPTEREGQHYLSDKDAARPSHNRTDASGLTVRDVFSRKNFWLLNFGYLSIIACTAGSLQNLAPIVMHDGLDRRTAGVLLSGFSVSHLFSTVIMGLLSDRFGNRLPLTGLALVTAAGTALIAFGHTTSVLGLGVMLIGFSGGIWPLMSAAIAIEFGTQAMGRAFGILGAFLPFAVVTPFIVAKMQESTGSYTPALTGLAVLAVLGAGACLMMRERSEG